MQSKCIIPFLGILLSTGSIAVQRLAAQTEIPLDTSFTTHSAAEQVLKEYPFARVVDARLPYDVVAHENLIYISYGTRDLHLDRFEPENLEKGPYPAVLLIHGGGWRSGNRTMEHPMAEQIAEHGYVTATVEYRLSPEALYPAAVHDLKAAVRWMRAHATSYNVDSNRIGVMGFSAGGQLAALIGTTNGMQKFESGVGIARYSTFVQAVVDIDGILDFTDPAESGKDTGSAGPSAGKAWFGTSYNEKPELWRDASPLQHVSETTPPMIFINSSHDRFHAGRDEMITELKKLGIYYEVHTMLQTPHTFWLFHPWFETTRDYAVGFLYRVLKAR